MIYQQPKEGTAIKRAEWSAILSEFSNALAQLCVRIEQEG